MTQYSTARNSSDYLSGKPDARTGLFAKTLTLGNLKGNYLAGPSYKLQLGFNPQQGFMNTLTPFGSGWGLSSHAFIQSTSYGDGHLTLPSGKSFYIPELSDGKVQLEGYLLSDVLIFWDSADRTMTVRQKNGYVHVYTALPGDQSSGNLYLSQTTNGDGRSLFFTYENSTFPAEDTMLVCLTGVTDDTGALLASVDYTGAAASGTVVTLDPDAGTSRQFSFLQANNSLQTIYGPEGYQADFTYYDNASDGGVAMYLLSTVADTSGLYETVEYSTPSTGGITLPGGTQIQNTVLTYRRAGDLTDSSSDYIATYTFTPGADQYNYLGNPAVANSQVDERTDSLLHYDGPFNYTSVMTEQARWPSPSAPDALITVNKTTTSTYNKFHALTQKVVSYASGDGQYDGHHSLTETLTYNATDGTIDDQEPTYALPLSHVKIWDNGDGSAPRAETQSFTWDDFANLTRRTDKTGVVTTREYYSAAGSAGCPADPNGFVVHLKQKIIIPGAPSETGLPAAPTRQYDYTWVTVKGYNGALPVHRAGMTFSADGGSTVLQAKHWAWQDDAGESAPVRLVSSAVILNGKTTTTELNYGLQKDPNNNTLLRTVVTKTGYDGLVHKERFDRSVMTGKMGASADITVSDSRPAVTMDYVYDALGRPTQKIACKGSAFESSQTYRYTPSPLKQAVVSVNDINLNPRLSSVPSANPMKVITDAHGVQSQSVMDSAGNTLEQWKQDADAVVTTDTTRFWQLSKVSYDGQGNTLTSVSYDWSRAASSPFVSATTTTLYDIWGSSYATLTPDGHTETAQHDPVSQVTTSFLTGTDGKITQTQRETEDVSGNTLKTERLNDDGTTVYSSETTGYDGLGRQARRTDAMNNTTMVTWDSFDRPLQVVRPDGAVLSPSWAPHSSDSLMSAIAVAEGSDTGADNYTYGIRTFDGLDRVTDMDVGGRQSVYVYSDGCATKPETVTTPAGVTLTYTYQMELSEAVLSVISDATEQEAKLSFTYNPTTGEVLTSDSDIAADDYAHTTLSWTPSGQQQSSALSYQLNGGEAGSGTQSADWSLAGRLLTTTDAGGLVHVMNYDALGRQSGYTLTADTDTPSATLSSVVYRYDSTGLQDQTTTTDSVSGNVQTTTVTRDAQGREAQRTLVVSGTVSASQEQTLAYNKNDQITTRTSVRGGQTLRTETYDYTSLNQMKTYTCTGDYPDSPDGYRLTGQEFTFDFIGNISAVTSSLLDSNNTAVTNTATYVAGTTDRTLLTAVTNDWVTAWDVSLSYDGNGNMTTDEQHRHLAYNSRSQLMSLSDPQSQPMGWFRYDANGIQIAEKNETDTDATTLYYQTGGVLMNEMQGTLSSTYVDTLACAFRGDGADSVQLLGSDQQGSVVQISDDSEVAWRVYDPYGYSK